MAETLGQEMFDPRAMRLRELFGPEGVSEAYAMIGQPMPAELFLEGLALEAQLQQSAFESTPSSQQS
jgi:hypothetical protein